MQQEHALVPEIVGDCGARFVIGRQVRQFIVPAKCLTGRPGTNAAGDVNLLIHTITPNQVQGMHVPLVARQRRRVRHAAIQISGANGVPRCFRLVHRRNARLVIIVAARITAAHVQKIFCQGQVLFVAGHPVEFAKAHLDDFVAGPDVKLVGSRAKRNAQQVRFLEGHVEQVGFARGLVMRRSRLEQMARVIKLMAELLLVHPAIGAGPFMRVLGINRARRVKITVGLLCRRNQRDKLVEVRRHFWIRLDRERIRRAFKHFVRVRIIERIPRCLAVGDIFPAQHRRRALEIIHAAGFLAFAERIRNRRYPVGFQARRPERIVQVDRREWHWLERIIVRPRRKG